MSWNVTLHPKARKGIARLPARVRATLALLLREIELNGPARGDWLLPTAHMEPFRDRGNGATP